MLVITEKQFSEIEYVVGNSTTNVLENTERLIIL